MNAVLSQVRSAVLRRRAQTVIVLIVSLLAAAVSTMALTLLVRSDQPWNDAYARLSGPDLVFDLDAARITPEQLVATRSLPGVRAAGPALELANVPFALGNQKGVIQVVGRDGPGGDRGRLAVSAGRWPQQPGEIAVVPPGNFGETIEPRLGDTLQAITAKRLVTFKVVGEVIDLTALNALGAQERAWVLPAELEPLVDGDQVRPGYEMPYWFQRAATAADLAADRQLVEAALPAGSEIKPPVDRLSMRSGANWLVPAVSSVIFAFSVFALLGVAVIVGSVVAGTAISGFREIGIVKALGFTPAEVAMVIVGQIAVPAMLGGILGVPVGSLISRPFLNETSASLRLPAVSPVDPAVDLAVPAGLLLLTVLAALMPALRAARTNSVRAIQLGSAPRAARRSWLGAVLARFGVPRPLSLGVGDAFARPVRAVLTLAALGIGIATLTFAFTFGQAMQTFAADKASYNSAQDLIVDRYPGLDDAGATALIAAQPDTRTVIATRQFALTLSGHPGAEPLIGMRGDGPGFGYHAVIGRWFARPGEAVVASMTAHDAHLTVGDSVIATLEGQPLRLRIVGIDDDLGSDGRGFRVGWDTVAAALPQAAPDHYLVKLRSGADVAAVEKQILAGNPQGLSVTVQPWGLWATAYIAILDSLVGGLTLVLAIVAAAGVFNATLLSTRERVHDIAALKALGMTPAQIGVMAIAAALILALLAAAVGIPVGMWLLSVIVGAFETLYGFIVPTPFTPGVLPAVLIVTGAFLVAVAGAALPARWAAATPVAEVLRSE